MHTRRAVLGRAALGLATASGLLRGTPALAGACDLPEGETARIIVPYSAGGGYDTYARLVATHLADPLGATLVVQNVTGGGGLVGSHAVRDAAADGLTFGVVDLTSLLLQHWSRKDEVLDPLEDLSILGQVDRSLKVWITSATSGIRSIEQLAQRPSGQPVVAGGVALNATYALNPVLIGEVLGLSVKLVTGYRGSQEMLLSLLRGETEIQDVTVETALPLLESGEARALLQLSSEPATGHPTLAGVPVLAGPASLAARLAGQRGASVEAASRLAGTMSEICQARRALVAPAGLDPALRECLRTQFLVAVGTPGFAADAAAAKRPFEPLPGEELKRQLQTVAAELPALMPKIDEALRRQRA